MTILDTSEVATGVAPRPSAIVATGVAENHVPAPVGFDVADPVNAELAALLDRGVPVERVVDLYAEVDDFIADIEAKLAPARARRNALKAITDAKMRDKNATTLVAGGWRATMKPGAKQTEKRVDVLRQLADLKNADGDPLIPPDELKKALWLTQPEPQWNTHLTYLRKLTAYGAEVQEILARGVVESVGLPVLVFERIEKVVTPISGAAR